VVEALGNVDELNAWLGLCRAKLSDEKMKGVLERAQQNLFIIQAEIAGADKVLAEREVKELEKVIDSVERELPEVATFLVAGATELGACFDVARAIARRAERQVIRAVKAGELKTGDATKAYLNRLSSLLYVIERWVVQKAGGEEMPPRYNGL